MRFSQQLHLLHTAYLKTLFLSPSFLSAAHYNLPVLAKLPIDPKLAAAVDAGCIEDAKLPDAVGGALKVVEDLR